MKSNLASREKNSRAASPAQPKTRATANPPTPRKPRPKTSPAEEGEALVRQLDTFMCEFPTGEPDQYKTVAGFIHEMTAGLRTPKSCEQIEDEVYFNLAELRQRLGAEKYAELAKEMHVRVEIAKPRPVTLAADEKSPFGRWPICVAAATGMESAPLKASDAAGLMSLAFVRHRAHFRELQGTLLAGDEVRESAVLLDAWMLADAVIKRLAMPGQAAPDAQDEPFRVPLPSLAGFIRHDWRDAACTLAFALYNNADATSAYLRQRVSCDGERAELAEALMVAEAVIACEGSATELEGRGFTDPPTRLQAAARLEIALLGAHS